VDGASVGSATDSRSGACSNPPVERVHEQVRRILASRPFSKSERMRRFLSYSLERQLSGSSDGLKEYEIALQVFDKSETFDPRLDPIVRVEARRLRSKLREYYSSDGIRDEILIEVPKRSYQPVIRWKDTLTGEEGLPVKSVPMEAAPQAHPSSTPGPSVDSITVAVLPFLDLSPRKDQGYFCDGMTEEIINALARGTGLRVVSRTSTMRYKWDFGDVRQIGLQLNVRTVLEGSIRKAGNRVRISAQLVDVQDGCHLWSNIFERKTDDILDAQREIAAAITRALQAELDAPVAGGRLRGSSRIPGACEHYLRGWHHWYRCGKRDLQRAVFHFSRAVELDPRYSQAHAGLAVTYAALTWLGAIHPEEGSRLIEAAAQKALEIDSDSGSARSALAFVLAARHWRWVEAEQAFAEAFRNEPRGATTHYLFAVFCLAPQLRISQALFELDQARQLEPAAASLETQRGWLLYLQRDYPASLDALTSSIRLDATHYGAHWYQAFVYEQLGMPEVALASAEKALELEPKVPAITGTLGRIHAVLGNEEQARRLLNKLARLSGREYVSPVEVAHIQIGLGAADEALSSLQAAAGLRCPRLIHLGADPAFDLLKDSPLYLAVLEQLGLPKG
jgi:TolB-like protein/Tfp pilus assembly protein PilF